MTETKPKFRCGFEGHGRGLEPCKAYVSENGQRCAAHTPQGLEKTEALRIQIVAERLAAKEKSVMEMEKLFREARDRFQSLAGHHREMVKRIEELQARLEFLSGWRQHSAEMLARSRELLMRESVTQADQALAQTLVEAATEIRIAGGGAVYSNTNQGRPGIRKASEERDLE